MAYIRYTLLRRHQVYRYVNYRMTNNLVSVTIIISMDWESSKMYGRRVKGNDDE